VKAMARAGGEGQKSGAGKGQKRGNRDVFHSRSFFNKTTLGGTLFAFASMLVGNWLDKKLSERKERQKNESSFSESDR
jgi:hypothetical protein